MCVCGGGGRRCGCRESIMLFIILCDVTIRGKKMYEFISPLLVFFFYVRVCFFFRVFPSEEKKKRMTINIHPRLM